MRRVLAIFLDGYDHALGQRLMSAGELPEMTRLAGASARFLLDHGPAQRTGLAGEHIATGLSPDAAQRWSAVHFDPQSYTAWLEGTQLPPFPADLPVRTVVFDATYFDLDAAPAVTGLVGWGSHDPGAPQRSRPPDLLSEFSVKFGEYSAQPWIYGFAWPSAEESDAMGRDLARAVETRTDAALWLLGERLPEWDLALVTIGEAHSASEGLWHGIDPNHPLHEMPGATAAGAGMHAVYHAVDRMVGRLTAAFPDALTIVFALGGMGENRSDVPSMLLLPELLYRHAFGSSYFRQPQGWVGIDPRSPVILPEGQSWEGCIAAQLPERPEPRLRRVAARVLPRPVKALLRQALIRPARPEPTPVVRHPLSWMPATAYQPFWRSMSAFAVPSFYDGRVRLNLIGRERNGVVKHDDYVTTT